MLQKTLKKVFVTVGSLSTHLADIMKLKDGKIRAMFLPTDTSALIQ
jgi:hypothetical protein